jgi:hypothetical protein
VVVMVVVVMVVVVVAVVVCWSDGASPHWAPTALPQLAVPGKGKQRSVLVRAFALFVSSESHPTAGWRRREIVPLFVRACSV